MDKIKSPSYAPTPGLPASKKGLTSGLIPQFEDDLAEIYLASTGASFLVILTRAEFNALSPPDPTTLYFING